MSQFLPTAQSPTDREGSADLMRVRIVFQMGDSSECFVHTIAGVVNVTWVKILLLTQATSQP
jgi:hypothetical protein